MEWEQLEMTQFEDSLTMSLPFKEKMFSDYSFNFVFNENMKSQMIFIPKYLFNLALPTLPSLLLYPNRSDLLKA